MVMYVNIIYGEHHTERERNEEISISISMLNVCDRYVACVD
jgi:hypothetical protein